MGILVLFIIINCYLVVSRLVFAAYSMFESKHKFSANMERKVYNSLVWPSTALVVILLVLLYLFNKLFGNNIIFSDYIKRSLI